MNKPKLEKYVNKEGIETSMVHRGKFNENDKHWGMRSNLNFRKKLEATT